jgi:quercetin dioxygenase-like cupin family protein
MSENRAQATVLVENEKVKVSEWRFRAGAATGYHRHEYDYVVVPLHTGSLTMLSDTGDRTEASLTVGAPYYRDAGVEHDVLYEGEGEFAFIEIELMGKESGS